MKKTRLFSTMASIIASTAVVHLARAEESSSSLDAHVHGLSELVIAMEGGRLEIEFTSPAINLVGFEHKASSTKDKQAVDRAVLKLRQHKKLFLMSGGGCAHIETSIDIAGLIEAEDHDHAPHKDATEHEHDGHKTNHEEHGETNSHSDVVASYQYRCENIAELSELSVGLFETFPGIDKMIAQWVAPTQQGAATLTVNSSIIKFR